MIECIEICRETIPIHHNQVKPRLFRPIPVFPVLRLLRVFLVFLFLQAGMRIIRERERNKVEKKSSDKWRHHQILPPFSNAKWNHAWQYENSHVTFKKEETSKKQLQPGIYTGYYMHFGMKVFTRHYQNDISNNYHQMLVLIAFISTTG